MLLVRAGPVARGAWMAVLFAAACHKDGPTAPASADSFLIGSCGGAVWVAYQDDDGPWVGAVGDAANNYRITVKVRGALATVTPRQSGGFTTFITYATAAQLAGHSPPCDTTTQTQSTRTATVGVIGLTSQEFASIRLGGWPSLATAIQPTSSFTTLPAGPLNLLAGRFTMAQTFAGSDRFVIRLGIDPGAGATLPAIDFGAPEAIAPAIAGLTIIGPRAEQVTATAMVAMSGGWSTLLGKPAVQFHGSYAGIPASELAPGLLNGIALNSRDGAESGESSPSRLTRMYFREVSDRVIALGADLAEPAISVIATAPALRLAAHMPWQSDYDAVMQVSLASGTPLEAGYRAVVVQTTREYLAAPGATWDLSVPDMSAAGYAAAWGLIPGSALTWRAAGSGGASLLDMQVPAEGRVVRSATRASTSVVALTDRVR